MSPMPDRQTDSQSKDSATQLLTKYKSGALVTQLQTRSSWLNCALRDDEAVYWVSIGHYEAVAVGN